MHIRVQLTDILFRSDTEDYISEITMVIIPFPIYSHRSHRHSISINPSISALDRGVAMRVLVARPLSRSRAKTR